MLSGTSSNRYSDGAVYNGTMIDTQGVQDYMAKLDTTNKDVPGKEDLLVMVFDLVGNGVEPMGKSLYTINLVATFAWTGLLGTGEVRVLGIGKIKDSVRKLTFTQKNTDQWGFVTYQGFHYVHSFWASKVTGDPRISISLDSKEEALYTGAVTVVLGAVIMAAGRTKPPRVDFELDGELRLLYDMDDDWIIVA